MFVVRDIVVDCRRLVYGFYDFIIVGLWLNIVVSEKVSVWVMLNLRFRRRNIVVCSIEDLLKDMISCSGFTSWKQDAE
jgi:hypothetical protein